MLARIAGFISIALKFFILPLIFTSKTSNQYLVVIYKHRTHIKCVFS